MRTLALALFIAIVVVVIRPHVPVDDAYIAFRYAENLALGNGAVFNVGERVEGFSSLAWLLLLAAAAALGLPLPGSAVLLGAACGAMTILVVGRPEGLRGAAAALLTAGCLPLAYHVSNGLETGLCALLVTLLAGCRHPSRADRFTLPAVAAALAWTRPEGVLLVTAWSVASKLAGRWERRQWWVAAAAWGAFLVQLAVRLAYFGELVPNAARAKLMPLALAWPRGFQDLAAFAWSVSGLGILLVAAAAAVHGAWRDRAEHSEEAAWTLHQALFLLAAGALLATSGGDSFPLWRFLVPLAPILFAVAARGLWSRPSRRRRTDAAWRLALVALAMAAAFLPYRSQSDSLAREGAWVRHWRLVGRRLAEAVPPGTSIALSPVGAIPFYSRLPTIDMLGLTDSRVARRPPDTSYWYPGHQRHDGAYVLGRRPDLVVLGNAPVVSEPRPFPRAELRIYERDLGYDPRFRRGYELWHLPLGDGTFAQIFARRELLPRLSPGAPGAARQAAPARM